MKPSEIATSIRALILAEQPAHVTGEPGVGKTSVWKQVAHDLDMDLKVTRLAGKEPTDFFLPIPDLKNNTFNFVTSSDLPKAGKRKILWLFDEWAQGLPATQNVAGELLRERRLGEWKLPDNVYIGAASNRAKDRAATNRIPSHIADRFFWLPMDVDVGDWCKWAFSVGIETEVIAFIRWRDELLSKFDPNADVSPTCRSWEGVSTVLKTTRAKKLALAPDVEQAIYAGRVGPGAAAEFMGFTKIFRKLPDPTAMLMNPDRCELPSEPATLCAVCTGISKKATDANMDRVVKIANRLKDEYSVLMMSLVQGRDQELASTRAFTEWAVNHQEALL